MRIIGINERAGTGESVICRIPINPLFQQEAVVVDVQSSFLVEDHTWPLRFHLLAGLLPKGEPNPRYVVYCLTVKEGGDFLGVLQSPAPFGSLLQVFARVLFGTLVTLIKNQNVVVLDEVHVGNCASLENAFRSPDVSDVMSQIA